MGDPFLFGLFLLSGIKISCLYDPTPPNKNNHRPPTPPSKIDIGSCNEGRHFKRYIIYCPMFSWQEISRPKPKIRQIRLDKSHHERLEIKFQKSSKLS